MIPTEPAPYPISIAYWRSLVGQVEPASVGCMLHVNQRTASRWWSGDQPIPWAAAELMRRMLLELSADSLYWKTKRPSPIGGLYANP